MIPLALLVQALPREPEAERAAFQLAPGFEAELVAAEPDLRKVVDIAFDDAGRMWAITASEYPLDGNEDPRAAELFRRGGADQVLVFDEPTRAERQVPRVFADGLALPLALLPVGGGVLVGHGPEILFLADGDGDGRAERREVVLSGFGIEDSHLLPHRFVRGPGEWIWLAQGAFNHSLVLTTSGASVPFEQCKLARFRRDGSAFEVLGAGLNNIWGLVIDRTGEMFVQEANDLGFPLVPFFAYASYPGIGDHRLRPHSPWQPALASFAMGGTGLSGLALAQDRAGFPPPWDETFFVANPIVGAVQAIAVDRAQDVSRLERASDLIVSADPWFRPVAAHFGPDGCLYVVDWYNEIISHNEVPRSDPRRDKLRSRIWRIRHASMARRDPPDLTRASASALLAHLGADSTWESRAAWHQIVDRELTELVPELERLALDASAERETRVLALWSLEGLGAASVPLLEALGRGTDPDLAREAARAIPSLPEPRAASAALLELARHRDLRTRLAALASAIELVQRGALPADAAWLDIASAPPTGDTARERYLAFERSLLRTVLEKLELLPEDALIAERAVEGVALFALARAEAELMLALEPRLGRPLVDEELALALSARGDARAERLLRQLLAEETSAERTLRILLERPLEQSAPELVPGARLLLRSRASLERNLVGVRAAEAFALRELAPELESLAFDPERERALRARALAALIELDLAPAAACFDVAASALPGEELERLASIGLARSAAEGATALLMELAPRLAPAARRAALRELSSGPAGSRRTLDALMEGTLDRTWLDRELLQRLREAATNAAERERLDALSANGGISALRLEGGRDDALDTDLALRGAFSVEAWVRLEEPVTNADGILAAEEGADFNFADGRFRLWAGAACGDVVIAASRIEPDTWTHVALVRSADGHFALYLNGELDAESETDCTADFERLDVGRTLPPEGTRGWIAQMRVWSSARTAEEIGREFQRPGDDRAPHPELVHSFAEAHDFAPLSGAARVETLLDGPPLLGAEELAAREAERARARSLAAAGGDLERGRTVFARACQTCHALQGEGAAIGPPLDGAGWRGAEGLVRAIATPSAAIESGYRLLLVETRAGERLEGFLASQDERSIVLRRQSREDLRLSRAEIASLRFDRLSVMPEGLLATLSDAEAADLLAFLLGLR